MGEYNEYYLSRFELLKFHERADGSYRIVIYGTGQWTGHIMDWLGCNFMHGRLPNSPIFDNPEEAEEWLRTVWVAHTEDYLNPDGGYSGHHAGEYKCSKGCDNRRVRDVQIPHPQDWYSLSRGEACLSVDTING